MPVVPWHMKTPPVTCRDRAETRPSFGWIECTWCSVHWGDGTQPLCPSPVMGSYGYPIAGTCRGGC
jgi:hypothetical protein